jgi:hypothetical protein
MMQEQEPSSLRREAQLRLLGCCCSCCGCSNLVSSDQIRQTESPLLLSLSQNGPFDENNVLNGVYASALSKNFPPIGDLVLVKQETVQPSGCKLLLPKSVNRKIYETVDLRLPHENVLIGSSGPLFDMRDDMLKVIASKRFAHMLLIGSSGCGKTTTAFMLAKESFCIYIEHWADEGVLRHDFNVSAIDLKRVRDGHGDRMSTLKRQMQREVLALCSLLAILHNHYTITPYQWFLLSISDNDVFSRMLQSLRNVFDGTVSDDIVRDIMGAVERQLCVKPTLIVDEAHLLVETTRNNGEGQCLDTFGATMCVVSNYLSPYLAACVWIGTQVSLEQAARVSSAVSKYSERDEKPVYAFCSFPYVSAKHFAKLASDVFVEDYSAASTLLYGRARHFSSLVMHVISKKARGFSTSDVIGMTLSNVKLVDEIKRVVGPKFSHENLLDLWMAAISYDAGDKDFVQTISPE